jgi:hypothetical protein
VSVLEEPRGVAAARVVLTVLFVNIGQPRMASCTTVVLLIVFILVCMCSC